MGNEDADAAWVAEAKRRLENVRSGRSKVVPSEQVELELELLIEAYEPPRTR